MVKSHRTREHGFTLIEILIVLAVLAILAAVVVPNVYGFVTQGKDRAFKADQRMLQAAVDAWRTDVSSRSGNQWPTVDGVKGVLADADADGVDVTGAAEDSSVIKVSLLTTGNYLQGNDAVKSMAYSTGTDSGATNTPIGSYVWYVDASGRVQASQWTDANDDDIVDVGAELTAGFQAGVYP